MEHHNLVGWMDMSGQIKSPEQIQGSVVVGNETYVAQWESTKDIKVTFYGNGGKPTTMTRMYAYGERLGSLSTMDEYPSSAIGFDGWYTSSDGGDKVNESSRVEVDTALYAHWVVDEDEADGYI